MSVVFHADCPAVPGHEEQADLRAERVRWLRAQVTAIEGLAEPRCRERRLSLGAAALDTALGGGLDAGGLHEIYPADARAHAATLWFAAMLAAQVPGRILWCSGHGDMFAPGLWTAGLAPERIIHARTAGMDALLSCMEEGLGAVSAIIGEPARDVSMAATRRLQLGSVREATLVLLVYRPPAREAFAPTAAASRWRLGVVPSVRSRARALSGSVGLGKRSLRLDLLRLRGRGLVGPRSWVVEMCDGAAGFAVVADVANRSAAPQLQAERNRDWQRAG